MFLSMTIHARLSSCGLKQRQAKKQRGKERYDNMPNEEKHARIAYTILSQNKRLESMTEEQRHVKKLCKKNLDKERYENMSPDEKQAKVENRRKLRLKNMVHKKVTENITGDRNLLQKEKKKLWLVMRGETKKKGIK